MRGAGRLWLKRGGPIDPGEGCLYTMVVAYSYPFGKDDDLLPHLLAGLQTVDPGSHAEADTDPPSAPPTPPTPPDVIGRHNAIRTRRYIRYLMGLTPDAAIRTELDRYSTRPPVFRTMRRGQIILRSLGIDLAKHRPDGTWAVRPDYHRYTNITYRVNDIQIVLGLAGYTLTHTDPRTRWTIWQRPA